MLSARLPRSWDRDVEERAHIQIADIPIIRHSDYRDVHPVGLASVVTRDLPLSLIHTDWKYWTSLAIDVERAIRDNLTIEFRQNPNTEVNGQTACYEWLMSDKGMKRPVSMTEVLIAAFAIQQHLHSVSSVVRSARIMTRSEEGVTVGDIAFALSTFRHELFGAMYIEAEPDSAEENATVCQTNHKRHWWLTRGTKDGRAFRHDGEQYDALVWSWLFGYMMSLKPKDINKLSGFSLSAIAQCVLTGVNSYDAIVAVATGQMTADLAQEVFA